MADRTITLKIKSDDREALASVARLSKAINGVNNPSSNGRVRSPIAGFDVTEIKRAFADIDKLSKQQQSFARIAYKGEVAQATQAAKEKAKVAEVFARQQAQSQKQASASAEAAKRREFSEFQRIEREKSRLVQAEARKQNAASRTGGGITRGAAIGGFVGNIAAQAVSSVTSAITEGASALLDYSAKLEQTHIGFTTLIGSADGAQAHIAALQQFAKTTPFEFAGLTDASRRLQSVGVQADRVIPIMTAVGNAVAAAGGTSESLDRVTLALSQIIAKGKVSAEELNQLNDAGVSGLQILSTQTGKTSAEILKLSSEGKISADLFVQAFEQFSKNKFGDAMEKQSHTFTGALSNIKDGLLIAGTQYFAPLFKSISEIADRTAKELEGADFGQAVKILAKNIAQGFGAALKAEISSLNFSDIFSLNNVLNDVGNEIKKATIGDFNLVDFFSDSAGNKNNNLGAFIQTGTEIGGAVKQGINKELEKPISKFTANNLAKAIDLGGEKFKLDQLTNTLQRIKEEITATPNLAKQLAATKAAEEAKKLGEELTKISVDYARRIQFFGDETEVAAAKQQLLAKGVSDFGSGAAKSIISLAAMLDKLKENQKATEKATEDAKKAQDEYNDKLKSARDEIIQIREDAAFKIKFAEPTELDNFNHLIQKSAGSFRELAPEIAATRRQLLLLQETQSVSKRGESQKGVIGDIQSQIRELENINTDSLTDKLRGISDVLNLKGFKTLGIDNQSDVTRDAFADRVKSFIENIKVLENAGVSADKVKQSFAGFLATFKTDETNSLGQQLQVFTDDKIPQLIELFLQLSGAIDKSSQAAAQANFKDVASGLDEEIASLNRELAGGIELSRADALAKQLQTEAYKNFTPEMKAAAVAKAQEIDGLRASIEAQEQYRAAFEKTASVFENALTKIVEGDFKGLFKSILDQLKQFLIRAAAQWLTSKFFKLLNPSANGGATQSSGGIGSIFSGLFGGGNQNRSSPGGGAAQSSGGINLGGLFGGNQGGGIFNFGGSNSFSGVPMSSASGGGNGGRNPLAVDFGLSRGGGSGAQQGGSIGGLFKKLSATPGITGGFLGAGLGSQVGGGFGSILGGAGGLIGGTLLTGLLTTGSVAGATTGGIFGASAGLFGLSGAATFGIGAAIAGGVLLASYLIGRSSRRKKEEKKRTQFLQDSFKGLEGFDKIISDVRALRVDGASGISQGEQLGQTIRAAYLEQSNSLKDKKTRNIALKDVSRIDSIIKTKLDELRKVADIANAANSRHNRLLPEFAKGNFFASDNQLKEMIDSRRGFINGGRIGVDRHLGLFADGELIANKEHQRRINAAAGFDVIAHAGIPNYPRGNKSGKYADGNVFGAGVVATTAAAPVIVNNFTIELEGVTFSENAKAWVRSDDGRRVLANVVNTEVKERSVR